MLFRTLLLLCLPKSVCAERNFLSAMLRLLQLALRPKTLIHIVVFRITLKCELLIRREICAALYVYVENTKNAR
jgi:hypothetical protein